MVLRVRRLLCVAPKVLRGHKSKSFGSVDICESNQDNSVGLAYVIRLQKYRRRHDRQCGQVGARNSKALPLEKAPAPSITCSPNLACTQPSRIPMKPADGKRIAANWVCDLCRLRQKVQARPLAPRLQTRSSSNAPRRGKLPDSPARTRFAPSPTGNLHLGSIRTAAFNYLLAKRTNGQFLLRLEDTDRKRTIPGAEERLYDDLRWAGLHWDEGPVVGGQYGPYRQSDRLPIYQKRIKRLLQTGYAYRCFCSAERLDELNRRRHEKGLNLGYDRKCADVHQNESDEKAYRGEAYVVRFRAPQDRSRCRQGKKAAD